MKQRQVPAQQKTFKLNNPVVTSPSDMRKCLASDADSLPFVSIVVPVYNDDKRVGSCIEALLKQTYSHKRYEILIVDNGSTDDTRSVIQKYPVKLLVEQKIKSSYAARNKGVKSASGEVIGFTDADCIPSPDWIEKGVENLLRVPNCGLVAGRINPLFKDPKRPNAVETYESIMHFRQKKYVHSHKYGATANVFTYKKIFDKVGLFNDTLRSGGDNEWGRRVFTYGYRQLYADDTSVAHPVRNSLWNLYRRTVRLVGGNYSQRKDYLDMITLWIRSIRNTVAIVTRALFGMHPVDQLNGAKQKIHFISVCICVELFRNFERVRLLMGKKPSR
ncbi:MAG: glycosyltransferase [Deltaproteobacteria bacterium]|jgi:glycosyltransferase involved in cell wall biosynthesis|nr:glycosyltransferase [Deltaproteobacteria bacterium]